VNAPAQVGPDIVITIAANKCDLEKERSVPDAVIAAYAQQVGASYFNTSAKTGSGLEKVFQDIGRRALQRQHEKLARSSAAGSLGEPLSLSSQAMCQSESPLLVLSSSKSCSIVGGCRSGQVSI
jgi:GTPase SAR1 family protein